MFAGKRAGNGRVTTDVECMPSVTDEAGCPLKRVDNRFRSESGVLATKACVVNCSQDGSSSAPWAPVFTGHPSRRGALTSETWTSVRQLLAGPPHRTSREGCLPAAPRVPCPCPCVLFGNCILSPYTLWCSEGFSGQTPGRTWGRRGGGILTQRPVPA